MIGETPAGWGKPDISFEWSWYTHVPNELGAHVHV
jgi:hypothetical protein